MTIDAYLVTRAAADYPMHRPATLTTPRPGLRARSIAHAAYAVGQRHLDNIARAAHHQAPDIAPDLLAELRTALTAQLQKQLRPIFDSASDGLRREGERARETAEAAAEPHRLHLDPESTAQMMRTDQAWRNTIAPALDAGKLWSEIISTLDADGLLAVERFAEGHESRTRDRFHQDEVPASVAGIREAVARRAVDIAPPAGRVALRDLEATDAALAYANQAMAAITAATPRNVVEIGLSLKRGAFAIGAQVPVSTSPEALAAYEADLAGNGDAATAGAAESVAA